MNYTPKYNAVGLKEYLDKNPDAKLDFRDAILLNEIYNLIKKWSDINTIELNGCSYYNIAYDKLLKQLPHLDIKTKDGIAKRIKRGLMKEKLIQLHIDKSNNSKTYFFITPDGLKTLEARTENREGIGQKTERVSDDGTNNKTINNKNINNKRESKEKLSHFDFLNFNYPEDIVRIKGENRMYTDQWRLCINSFNEKNLKMVTINRFEKYVTNWFSFLKDDQKNAMPKFKRIGEPEPYRHKSAI